VSDTGIATEVYDTKRSNIGHDNAGAPAKGSCQAIEERKTTLKPAANRNGARKRAAAERPAPKRRTPSKLLTTVLTCLDDAKAEDVISIDLNGKGALADQMVIASGRSNRHVSAIADQLVEKLKAAGFANLRVEGVPQCDWVLVDSGDVVVHLFRPEVRSFYNLEKLWSPLAPEERIAV
jgi:ribosome-associated protein